MSSVSSEAHDDLGQWARPTPSTETAHVCRSARRSLLRVCRRKAGNSRTAAITERLNLRGRTQYFRECDREASLKLGATEAARTGRFDEVLNAVMPDLLQVAATIKHSAFFRRARNTIHLPGNPRGRSAYLLSRQGAISAFHTCTLIWAMSLWLCTKSWLVRGADQRSMEARVERLVREAGVAGAVHPWRYRHPLSRVW